MIDQPQNTQTVDGPELPCRRCHQPFQSKKMVFSAGQIEMAVTSTICNQCSIDEERELVESRERYRASQIQRQNEAREAAWAKLCPVEFRTKTEGGETDIVRLERESPKLPLLLAYQHGARGLIIRGETRKCKTRSTWRLMRKLWVEKRSIVALTAGEFDRECRDAAGSFKLTEWFNKLANVDVLFIDDLGKGEWKTSESSWFDLVDKRTREHRPIIITTNDDGDSLKARMSPHRAEALIARLRDYCDSITF